MQRENGMEIGSSSSNETLAQIITIITYWHGIMVVSRDDGVFGDKRNADDKIGECASIQCSVDAMLRMYIYISITIHINSNQLIVMHSHGKIKLYYYFFMLYLHVCIILYSILCFFSHRPKMWDVEIASNCRLTN